MLQLGSVVTPYSAIRETGANVPCLKHFFPMTERSGLTIADTKGGCVWKPPSIAFDSTLGTVYSGMLDSDSPTLLERGTWYPFGTQSLLIMYAGRLTSGTYARFSIGDINGTLPLTATGFGLSDGPFHTALGTNFPIPAVTARRYISPTESIGTTHTGKDVIVVSKYIPGVSLSCVGYNAVTGATLITANTTNVGVGYVTDVGVLTPDACMRVFGVKFYGAAYFSFSSFPSDIDTQCLWMGARWVSGDRSISPKLIGVS